MKVTSRRSITRRARRVDGRSSGDRSRTRSRTSRAPCTRHDRRALTTACSRSSSSHTRWRSPRSLPSARAAVDEVQAPAARAVGRDDRPLRQLEARPVVEHAQVHAVAGRAAAGPRPCPGDAGVADGVGDQLGGQQAQVLRGALAELGASGASAAATSRAACRVAGKRSGPARGGATCTARQAMSSRGLPSAIATAVALQVLDHRRAGPRPRARRRARRGRPRSGCRRGAAASLTPSV